MCTLRPFLKAEGAQEPGTILLCGKGILSHKNTVINLIFHILISAS